MKKKINFFLKNLGKIRLLSLFCDKMELRSVILFLFRFCSCAYTFQSVGPYANEWFGLCVWNIGEWVCIITATFRFGIEWQQTIILVKHWQYLDTFIFHEHVNKMIILRVCVCVCLTPEYDLVVWRCVIIKYLRVKRIIV